MRLHVQVKKFVVHRRRRCADIVEEQHGSRHQGTHGDNKEPWQSCPPGIRCRHIPADRTTRGYVCVMKSQRVGCFRILCSGILGSFSRQGSRGEGLQVVGRYEMMGACVGVGSR